MVIKALVASILMLGIPSLTFSQEVSEEKRADILKMVELSGALELGDQLGQAVIQQMTAAARARNPSVSPRALQVQAEVVTQHMNDFIRGPAFLDGIVTIYSGHFTHEEIKEIVEFYQTPVGSKMAAETAQLNAESAQLTQSLLPGVLPLIQRDIQERLQAEGLSL